MNNGLKGSLARLPKLAALASQFTWYLSWGQERAIHQSQGAGYSQSQYSQDCFVAGICSLIADEAFMLIVLTEKLSNHAQNSASERTVGGGRAVSLCLKS